LSDVLRPSWKDALRRLRMQLDIFGEVNSRWNARVDCASAGARFAQREYVSYVLNVYDELAKLDAALGPAALARVYAAWPNLPRTAESLDAAARSEQGAAWLSYLHQARQIIDGYYPGVMPRRATLLAPEDSGAPGTVAPARQAPAAPSESSAHTAEVGSGTSAADHAAGAAAGLPATDHAADAAAGTATSVCAAETEWPAPVDGASAAVSAPGARSTRARTMSSPADGAAVAVATGVGAAEGA
jgi:hypothetical protein